MISREAYQPNLVCDSQNYSMIPYYYSFTMNWLKRVTFNCRIWGEGKKKKISFCLSLILHTLTKMNATPYLNNNC